jgi:hypothetical protein
MWLALAQWPWDNHSMDITLTLPTSIGILKANLLKEEVEKRFGAKGLLGSAGADTLGIHIPLLLLEPMDQNEVLALLGGCVSGITDTVKIVIDGEEYWQYHRTQGSVLRWHAGKG